MNRQAKLDRLNREFAALLDQVYPEAAMTPVFGCGNVEARLMLVGEAPGRFEVEQGKPFVGKAGQNLDAFLELAHLDRDALYVTNTVKFRPVKIHPRTGSLSNRPPDREEIALCQGLLFREIALIRPKIVATLGNVPLNALAEDKTAIGQCHGTCFPCAVPGWNGILFPLYHPASLIYNPSLKDAYQQDVQRLGELVRAQ